MPSTFSGGATKLVPGVVRLVAHGAIELGRMRDRFVDREPEVRRMQHEIVAPDVDRLRGELLHRFVGPLRRVLDELRVAHMLVAEAARRDVDRLARGEVAVADRRHGHRRLRAIDGLHGELPSVDANVFSSRRKNMLELTKRAPFTASAASFAASSMPTLSSIATLNGSISIGLFHVPFATAGAGASTTGRTSAERFAFACATACLATRETSSRVRSRLAAKPHAPFDERANAESIRLVVGDTGDALLARRDVLIAIANEANVGVVSARALRGVEREHRELFDVGLGGDDRRIWRFERRDERVGRAKAGGNAGGETCHRRCR